MFHTMNPKVVKQMLMMAAVRLQVGARVGHSPLSSILSKSTALMHELA